MLPNKEVRCIDRIDRGREKVVVLNQHCDLVWCNELGAGGIARCEINVSCGSWRASLVMKTLTILTDSPGVNRSVPSAVV